MYKKVKNVANSKSDFHPILLWNRKIEYQNLKNLKDLTVKYRHQIVIKHLNISSMRNKFKMLSFVILGAIDIRLISEIKTDFPFPTSAFVKNGNPNIFKLALNENGG